jgi:hypothetical protein
LTGIGLIVCGSFAAAAAGQVAAERPASPESRAVAYLAREVPRWSARNHCYSCHNNGDAARALYAARRLSYPVPPEALADTTHWLSTPSAWDDNKGPPGSTDKGLARIQFATALADAIEAGAVKDRRALVHAAALVAKDQHTDGSWSVDAPGTIGSPVTYGACLATCQAQRTLKSADPGRYKAALSRADQWLQKVTVETVLNAAAVLLGLDGNTSPRAANQRGNCLAIIRKAQSADGGWGPYIHSRAEPFDTAIVVLSLSRRHGKLDELMRQRGRAFLIKTQQPDGSWVETTRPPGSESYAQRLSTSAWATLALLATAPKPR